MASTLIVMASYSLQEGIPMELDDDETSEKAERIGFGNGLKPFALPSLVDLVQVVTLVWFLTLESPHFGDLLEVLFFLQMMQHL
jgi:hypothetical protein